MKKYFQLNYRNNNKINKKEKIFTKLFTIIKRCVILPLFLKFTYSRYIFPEQGGESTSTTYIGLCGRLSLDVAVYLGQILKNLHKKVLIADLTESFGLQYLFSVSDNFPVTYQNVDYIGKDFHVYNSRNDSYDIVILCMTCNVRRAAGNRLSKIYYICDTEYENIIKMLGEIRNIKAVSGVILRDITDGGISAEYLLRYVFHDEYLLKIYQEGRVYQVQDDLTDREYRVGMQYGSFGEFRHLSPGFLKVLMCLTREITGCKRDEAAKALKYAKEGRNIEEYHFLEQCVGKKRNKR